MNSRQTHGTLFLFVFIPLAYFILSLFPPAVAPPGDAPAVTDMRGQPVHASLPAKKVLIFPVILSGYLAIDDGPGHILAVSEPARAQALSGFLGQAYPAVRDIPTLGATVAPLDPEQVILLKPDAVFVWAEQAAPLEKVGLPGLAAVRVRPGDQSGSRLDIWNLMGAISGRQARADSLLADYRARRREIQALIPGRTDDRPRVAILYRVGSGFWGIGGKNYNLNDRLEWAGGTNAARDFKPSSGGVDLEQLLLLDPDIILLNSGPAEDFPRDIYARPEWQSLRAVRDRRVYKMPVYSYINAVVNAPAEDPLLLLWMAELFYPGQMPRGLRDEFREIYKNIYHYDITEEEIDRAIFLRENLGSAGYERFGSGAAPQQ